jgi:hypothetical protein
VGVHPIIVAKRSVSGPEGGRALKRHGPDADDQPVMQTRQERVYLETPRHRIAGTLTLARDGYRSRVSDVLNASERDFIPLTDVTVELLGQDGPGTHHEFLAVSRHHVVIAIPELPEDGQLDAAAMAVPPAGAL